MKKILCLVLIAILMIPSNIVFASTVESDGNGNLSFLDVYGFNERDERVNLIENFDPSVTTYNISVENEVSEVDVWAEPENSEDTVSYTEVNKLQTGENKIEIKVTSQNGAEKLYVVNIERKSSSDCTIESIVINGEDYYMDDKKECNVKYLYDTKTVNIEAAYVNDASTKVTGLGEHDLKVGKNKITLTAIAENGAKNEYNITITRAKPTTALDYVMINEVDCGVDGNKVSLDVNYSTNKVKIKAKPIDKSAKVTGNGTYKLKVGKNTFHITVKAANGKTKKYTININRSKYKPIIIIIK